MPAPPWQWTDDTEMACSVYTEVLDRGRIDRDALAAVFADRCEPYRGYGPGTVVVLHEIRDGRPWADAAGAVFGGNGSWGNGAAMRVAPLGAYFAGDPERAAAYVAWSSRSVNTSWRNRTVSGSPTERRRPGECRSLFG
ncbi:MULTISPECIES: ADP-ribosylglycohydrolase family protein [Nocardia]|uniref:ADP-ribosylglycohydrolase family protein n=1 Tax=Nocardia elegans TaxID=300029 RepID=A0ABW6TBL5_9NOCA|nr:MULTISPECIES: ADP-ribosylglycohydrolase family protein [Nocardia]